MPSLIAHHRKLRESYRRAVESGTVSCARCLDLIAAPGQPCPRCGRLTIAGHAEGGNCGWDLGHDDVDRTLYHGPEHSCCNRRAGGKRGGRQRAIRHWSRRWIEES